MKNKFSENIILNESTSVLFATFAVYIKGKRLPSNGMIEPILSFFLPKVKDFTLLIQPHPGSDRISPILKVYEENRKIKEIVIPPIFYFPLYVLCKLKNNDDTHVSFKLRDFLSVLFVGFLTKDKFDLFIGLDSINTIAGILLKKLGRISKVVYYLSDYSPNRFGNFIFNAVYLRLDRFCVKHSDFTWDVSPSMKEGRVRLGMINEKDTRKIIHVPNGLFASQINPLAVTKRIPESIVYMGLLHNDQHGIDLGLEAFKLVLKKKHNATLHIIGGSNRDLKPFSQSLKDLGIEKSVILHGFISPNEKMSNIVNKCYVGIATYRSDRNPRNQYGDSGKIRQYLACGLPIVATTIQWYTKYAIESGAGIGVNETPEDFAKAIITLFEKKELYASCSKVATELGKKNTWENSYKDAFLSMGKSANISS